MPTIWPVKNLRPAHALAHMLAGAGLYLVLTPRHIWAPSPWLVLVAALAALAPDLDTLARIPHRTATHSLAAVGLVWWVAHTLAPPHLAAALAWGYASHILADMLHGHGVGWLWPLSPDHAQVAAVSVGTVATLAALTVWAGLTGDAPLYHLWRTPTPTPAPAPNNWPPCVPAADAVRVRVVQVIDGDTLIAAWPDGHTDRVRLLGVNAPEIAHPTYGKLTSEPLGNEATEWLRRVVATAPYIYAVPDRSRSRDRYGRLLAYIVADGRLVNADLLAVGLANLYMDSGLSCQDTLATAAAQAQLAGLGIWAQATPTPTPTPSPTPTVGYDYQAALLRLQAERVALQVTAVCATATANPWRYNQHWLDWQLARLTLDESEAWLRYQAWLAAHPPTPTPTPSPVLTSPPPVP